MTRLLPVLTPAAAHALAGSLLIAFTGFAVYELAAVLVRSQGEFLAFNDFFAQWSFAKFAHAGPAAAIYDADALHRFQLGLEPGMSKSFPFPYPPTYLLAIWPLGSLPFGAAQVLWDVVTLALFLWAALGRQWRTPAALFAALAPASVMTLAYGQNGFLLSALLVGGMHLVGTRSVLGGALLGLATIKPQLGLLVPFALTAAGQWRALLSAGLAAAGLALLAGWCFGAEAWAAWLQAVAGHASWVQNEVSAYRSPSLMATLDLFGLAPDLAQALQIGVCVVVIGLVWLCCREGWDPLALAVVQSGTYLAAPFFFVYDLPISVNAVLLYAQGRRDRRWTVLEAGVVALGLGFPALTTLTTRFFYMNTVALVLLFGLIAWRRLESTAGETETPRLEPGRPGSAAL